ncbi:hypothetical protein K8P03_11130 [Anaerococcus murdochii]|uniref:Uncharacterized protein n=1 Tax=Anaerococcus murdochii TaxID=411577 RepID=A0ABS7T221_9FIRM|nr:hypothetical protein [Anaerococcus murdochii]MBZ2387825.1 hypothetical protein [Anaerococcus murdochii]
MGIIKKLFKSAEKTPIDKETKYQEYLKRIKSGESLRVDWEDFCEISAIKQ